MLAVGDSAAADDAYSDFSSHIVSPIVFKIYYIYLYYQFNYKQLNK